MESSPPSIYRQSPIDIYSTLSLLSKPQFPNPELPNEVVTNIYMYLHEAIIEENNKKYIADRINSIPDVRERFTIHKAELPHPKKVTIKELR